MKIPDRIPSVYVDRLALGMDVSGLGRFVIQMEMDFAGPLDADRLATALDLMLDAEPVLGCRMVPDPKLPYWQRLPNSERKNFYSTSDEGESLRFRNTAPDCCKGPQLLACLLRRSGGDKLILKVCHQASDAGGVKDIAAELCAIYNRLEKDPGYQPEPNLFGCRDFGQVMRLLPLRAYPMIFLNFLRNWSNNLPAETLQMRLPPGPSEPLVYVIRHIPRERTERIAQFGKAHNATINDVMIAAYYQALAREFAWDGKSRLRLMTTIDLRRWYLPDEKAGGICNLSLYEYPGLGRNLGKDFAGTVDLVSRQTRARKKNWIGLTDVCAGPLFKLLSFESQVETVVKVMAYLSRRKAFPNMLTNMGEVKKDSVKFGVQPSRAFLLPPFIFPPFFAGSLSGYQGELSLCAGAPECSQDIISRFYDRVLEFLPA